jgi:HK97 family phage major capsid protein
MFTSAQVKARIDSLTADVEAAYKDFTNRKISEAAFHQVCAKAEEETVKIRTKAVGQKMAMAGRPEYAGGGLPGPVEGFVCRGAAPKLAFSEATTKAMWEAACTGSSYTATTKAFNTVESLLPPELAPYVVRWIHEWRILDKLPVQAVTAPSFEIIRHTSTSGSAAVTAEGASKPEIVLGMDEITLPMVKLACHGAASWEIISDHQRFLDYLMVELPLRVIDAENAQILYGNGVGQWEGFFNTSGVLTHNVSGATDTAALDAIEQSIEQLRTGTALAEPDLFITSPSSWSALRRIKDDLHRYILAADPSQDEVNTIWGVPVLVTTACHPGDGLLIDTNKFGRALIREGLVMRQGTTNDDFTRNLLRWVVEVRGNVATERPQAVLALSNLPTTAPPAGS